MAKEYNDQRYFDYKQQFLTQLRGMKPADTAEPEMQDAFVNAVEDYAELEN